MKTENIKVKGNITAMHGNGFYRVKVDKFPTDVIATLAGKMSKSFNKPEVSDYVDVELSPTDLTKGRIVKKW